MLGPRGGQERLAQPGSGAAPGGWPLILGDAAAALALGFALGWRTLDRRIRRKYGGLRIY
jgi:hypothetical protein